MRCAILLSLATLALTFSTVRADDSFVHINLGSLSGYIIPESYANANKAELVASIPGTAKVEGFWTPPEQDVVVADRVLREAIHAGIKDPKLLFPDIPQNADPASPDSLEHQRAELILVSAHYDHYSRQFIGIIIDGVKLVWCNYSEGTNLDPLTDYIYMQKAFIPDGKSHFLQCRFEPKEKIYSNLSFIGSWQPPAK